MHRDRQACVCRYATPGGFKEAALAAGLRGEELLDVEKQKLARQRMYSPGGPMARELAKNPTVLVVNDTLFAHGGVLKRHGELPGTQKGRSADLRLASQSSKGV